MEQSYRIKAEVGQDSVVKAQLKQDVSFLEILSLKIGQSEIYKQHTSNYGVIVGRVLANDAFGIPNAKVSVFIELTEEDKENGDIWNYYPYTSTQTTNKDGIRYNLLDDTSNDICHREVGTFPSKRLVLDNDDVIEIFDKYWQYTTTTNHAGDYMIMGVPIGNQKVHVDLDLSDIGILSQHPRDLIYKGYNVTQFDNANQFKDSTNLDNLTQIISQDNSVHVYPFWGDKEIDEIAITRCDIQIQYKFEPTCVFMGSIITDDFSNNIGHKCNPSKFMGFNRNLVAGEGTIEMIRKTTDGLVEEFQIQGNRLIDGNGVWCYQIPMNLDYVGMDEYGNIIPTDQPSKGIPTRTSVRFRVSMEETDNEGVSRHRAKYLVPNVHQLSNAQGVQIDNPQDYDSCYEFGSATPNEFFRDLYWNKVYTVKNYIPRIQRNRIKNTQKYSAIRTVNDHGAVNPFPFNKARFRLVFGYRVLCVIMSVVFKVVEVLNTLISSIVCLEFLGITPFKFLCRWIKCITIKGGLTEDDDSKVEYFPGCKRGCDCMMVCDNPGCTKETSYGVLMDVTQTNLAQEYDVVNLDFYNDWVNGTLYMPLWFWRKTKKRKFLFGLFTQKAKNIFCSCDRRFPRLRVTDACSLTWGNKKTGGSSTTKESEYRAHLLFPSMTSDVIKTGYGIIKEKETSTGLHVYYYAPGIPNKANYQTMEEPSSYIRLYATDIVLLGSLNSCDLDNLPRPFLNLPSTTSNIPYITTLMQTALEDDESQDMITSEDGINSYGQEGLVEVTGMDWGRKGASQTPKYGNGLFMNLSCIDVYTKPKSCINLERLCELGVNLDTHVDDLLVSSNGISYSNEKPADGMITRYELVDNETRSMFASLNQNGLTKKVYNPNTGYDTYMLEYTYMNDFDGKMGSYAQAYTAGSTFKTYDEPDQDYLNFRLGMMKGLNSSNERTLPHFYFGNSFPLYNNSFYFYFGSKEGSTAIDKFNHLFNATCYKNKKSPFVLTYKTSSGKWCKQLDDASSFGAFEVELKNIQTPYSYILYDNFNQVIMQENNMVRTDLKFGYAMSGDDYVYDENGKLVKSGEFIYIKPMSSDNDSAHESTHYLIDNATYVLQVTDSHGRSVKEIITIPQLNINATIESIPLGDKWEEDGDEVEICSKQLYGEINISNISIDGNEIHKFTKVVEIATDNNQQGRYKVICDDGSELEIKVTVNNEGNYGDYLCATQALEEYKDKGVISLRISKPSQFTVSIKQVCHGTSVGINEISSSVKVANGESFDVFLNDVPMRFLMPKNSGDNKKEDNFITELNHVAELNDIMDTSSMKLFNWDNPNNYYFPLMSPLAASQWSKYVTINTSTNNDNEEYLTVDSKINIILYELSCINKMAQACYVIDNLENTFRITTKGGKRPILLRANYPVYSYLDYTNNSENQLSDYVFDSYGYVTYDSKYPNIVGRNYAFDDTERGYGVPLDYYLDNLTYKVFNPVYDNNVGNYFAAFTNNGGIVQELNETTNLVTCNASDKPYIAVPSMAQPYVSVCPNAIVESPSLNMQSGYYRALSVDRRVDYNLAILTPNSRLKGRLKGSTYNGVEFAYDDQRNIFGTNLEYALADDMYFGGDDAQLMDGIDVSNTSTQRLKVYRRDIVKSGIMNYRIISGDAVSNTAPTTSTIYPAPYEFSLTSDNYKLDLRCRDDRGVVGIYGDNIADVGYSILHKSFNSSNYPYNRDISMSGLSETNKMTFKITPCSYDWEIDAEAMTYQISDTEEVTIMEPKCKISASETTEFKVDCTNPISPLGLNVEINKAKEGNIKYGNNGEVSFIQFNFKVKKDKYNTTHKVCSFVPFILGNNADIQSFINLADSNEFVKNIIEDRTLLSDRAKTADITNSDGTYGVEGQYADIIADGKMWVANGDINGNSTDLIYWAEPGTQMPLYEDDSRVQSMKYYISAQTNDLMFMVAKQYLNNEGDNLSKNLLVFNTAGEFSYTGQVSANGSVECVVEPHDEEGHDPYSAYTQSMSVTLTLPNALHSFGPKGKGVRTDVQASFIVYTGKKDAYTFDNYVAQVYCDDDDGLKWRFEFKDVRTTNQLIVVKPGSGKVSVWLMVQGVNNLISEFDLAAKIDSGKTTGKIDLRDNIS